MAASSSQGWGTGPESEPITAFYTLARVADFCNCVMRAIGTSSNGEGYDSILFELTRRMSLFCLTECGSGAGLTVLGVALLPRFLRQYKVKT